MQLTRRPEMKKLALLFAIVGAAGSLASSASAQPIIVQAPGGPYTCYPEGGHLVCRGPGGTIILDD
jgi:hypothetical protein